MNYEGSAFTANTVKVIGAIGLFVGLIYFFIGLGEVGKYHIPQLAQVYEESARVKIFIGLTTTISSFFLIAMSQAMSLLVIIARNTLEGGETNSAILGYLKGFGARMKILPIESEQLLGYIGAERAGKYRNFDFTLFPEGEVEGEARKGKYKFKNLSEYKTYVDQTYFDDASAKFS